MMHPIPHVIIFVLSYLLSFYHICYHIKVLTSEVHILTTFFLKIKFTNNFQPTGQQYHFLAFTLPSQRTDIL